jgi:LAGLIDADG-like domain
VTPMRLSPVEAAAAIELIERKRMALRIFRPQPHQDEFFKMPRPRYTLLLGGNRCVTSDTEVMLIKNGQHQAVRIKDIEIGDKILGLHQGAKRSDLDETEVLTKTTFTEDAYRITTKRGYRIEATKDHPVMCCPPILGGYNNGSAPDWKSLEWRSASEVPAGWYVRLASAPAWNGEIDEDAYMHGVMDGDGSCECYKYGVMKLTGHRDEYKSQYTSWVPEWTAPVAAGYIRGLFDTDGCVSTEGKVIFVQKDEQLARQVHNHLLTLLGIKSCLYKVGANPKQKRPNPTWRLVIAGANARIFRDRVGLSEVSKAEKLVKYVKGIAPKGQRLQWEPVRSVENIGPCEFVGIGTSLETYISNGIVSHNSGKTTCASVLFASIATDTPLTLSDGTEVSTRLPWQKERKLRMWVVGDGENHIGQTIHRVLFQSDLFRVVIDPITNELRAKRPEGDEHLKSKPSPPLIPKRYIKKFVWRELAKKVFESVVIQNPATGEEIAEIFAFSSKGEVKAGDPVDVVFVDERIPSTHDGGYISELKGRLVDAGNGVSNEGSGGQLFWSSWPTEDSEDLLQFKDMVEGLIESGRNDMARKVVLTMSGNKHLDRKSVAEFLSGCSPEEAMARDRGLMVGEAHLRIYPLYSKQIHVAYSSNTEEDDELARLLRMRDGIPPNDWTKYLVIDPGTSAPAALLCAVPPPEIGEFYIPYQEFYPGRADAIQLAQLVKREMPNEKFYQFIIDYRASRQTPMGFSSRIVDEYERAFLACGLTCHLTKGRFTPGSDNVGGRQMILNSWMHNGKTGRPKLRIVTHRCKSLTDQLFKLKKKMIQKEAKDERKQDGQPSDVADALAYFAGAGPRFVFVKPTLEDASPAFQRYMKRFGQPKEKTTLSIGTFY